VGQLSAVEEGGVGDTPSWASDRGMTRNVKATASSS
jgi:hypothetical protein